MQYLGTFVEIEAIDREGIFSREELQQQCEKYMKLFGIQEMDLVSVSYSDLLILSGPSPSHIATPAKRMR